MCEWYFPRRACHSDILCYLDLTSILYFFIIPIRIITIIIVRIMIMKTLLIQHSIYVNAIVNLTFEVIYKY